MYGATENDRKDLFQEIMIQLWQSYPAFRGDSKFSTWMYRVALNVALQHQRKTRNNKESVRGPEEFDRLPETKQNEPFEDKKQLLYTAIGSLNDVEKAIIMLYLEEVGNEEIANITGISQNYVRVKMTRIKKKLKKIIGADYGSQ